MKKIQGVLFDEQLNVYRRESFETKSQFIEVVKMLIDFTKGDEESYDYPVETEEEVNEFLELYGYRFTPLSDKQKNNFEEIMEQSELVSNRLSVKESILFDTILATDYVNSTTY